jgi:hypothetical protein
MSVLTFLKKAGQDIVQIAGIALGFVPLAQAASPNNAGLIGKVASELDQLKSLIIQVEAFGAALPAGMDGATKLKVATPMVAQLVLRSDMMLGHEIQDQALFTNGAEQIASGVANVLNSLKAK